jgi:hypothetical protein
MTTSELHDFFHLFLPKEEHTFCLLFITYELSQSTYENDT